MLSVGQIRVLIVDDYAPLRAQLRALLSAEPDMEVVGEAADGREAVEKALKLRPDVVLMDIAMPGMDGVEATRQIKARCPGTRVLFLSLHDCDEYLLAGLEAGGVGCMPKAMTPKELVEGVRAAHRWGAFLHPSGAKHLIEAYRDCAKAGASC